MELRSCINLGPVLLLKTLLVLFLDLSQVDFGLWENRLTPHQYLSYKRICPSMRGNAWQFKQRTGK